MTLTFYCMNCRKHFYSDHAEQAKLLELMHRLNEARELHVKLGLEGKARVPSVGKLVTNRAKCCDKPFLVAK